MKIRKKTWWGGALLGLVLVLAAVWLAACQGGQTVMLYDGEALLKTAYVTAGAEYDFGAPAKVGYTFLGWYSEADGGSAYTDADGKSAGMTWKEGNAPAAYAHWQPNRYTLTLDYCGATALNTVADITATYDAAITDKLPVPQKSGYAFLGWYTEKTGGTQVSDAAGNFLPEAAVYNASVYPLDDAGTTLYAHWGTQTVTYLFRAEDGTPVSELTYPVGTVLYDLPASVKDNYCFAAWCFDPTFLSPITFPYTIPETSESHVTLYAHFVPGTLDVLRFTAISSKGDREYEVSYSGNAETLVIPDTYYGKPVTRVGRIDAPAARTIMLPPSVRELTAGAFEGCAALTTVNIPAAVQAIPDRCFSGCAALTALLLPQKTATIGKEAFAGCAALTQVDLPAGVTAIGAGAFRNAASLVRFTVADGNEKYMAKDGVLYYRVGNSTHLVQYPAAKPGDTYALDPSVVKILAYAFSSSGLRSVTIGGKVSSVETGAFENCVRLVNVSIGGNAVTFSIGKDAFRGCSRLKAVKLDLAKVPTLHETAFDGVSGTFSVYVVSGMIRSYQTAANWRAIADRIYGTDTIFGDFAVAEVAGGYTIRQYFGTDAAVTIPAVLNARAIVGISENAFSFSDVERVTVPASVTAIGDRAFDGCASLSALVMEGEPPALGDHAFDGAAENFGIYIKNTAAVLDAYRTAEKWSAYAALIWSYQQ